MSSENMNRLARTEQRINRQLNDGFPWLRFSRKLEVPYRQWRLKMIKERARPVGLAVVGIFVVYSMMDVLLFPPELSWITAGIRMIMICPIVGLVVWASYQNWKESTFINFYTFAFLWVALGIAIMIMLSHQQRVWMPYDGLLLMLMGGYFLLALPFFHIVIASWLVIPIYVLCEIQTELPGQTLQFNIFFLLTANMIGTVGTYLVEHGHRTLYLNRQLLEIAKSKAEEDSEAKSRFVAMASHDLRQPLHAMHLMVENLETEVPVTNLPLVKRVKASVKELNQLMGSVLDLSKLNFGIVKVSKSHLSLGELCEKIVREYQNECQEKGITLTNDVMTNIWVYTDGVLLERVVRNLVVNAIDHSEADMIRLRGEAENGYVSLVVGDDGIGISDEDQQKIFNEFNHNGHGGDKRSGMGLGLAIVKQFSDLMGVSLSLESQLGQGSRFILSIKEGVADKEPAQTVAPEAHKVLSLEDSSNTPAHQAVSVIVIDDNVEACQSLAEVIQHWGYQVAFFSSPEAALSACEAQPDLIISDYHLQSGRTGMDLINALRERFESDIPAILMTADGDVAENTHPLPAMSIAQKPVMPAQLKLLMSDRLAS